MAVLTAPAAILVFMAGQVAAQADTQQVLRLAPPAPEIKTIVDISEVGDTLQVTAGHSRLLQGNAPFGTIIVGDDTIAGASIGPANSIILTGFTAGSTNLIVLDESQNLVLSAAIAVVPVTGPLRSTVTIFKGAETRETHECRGGSCQPLADEDTQREFPFVLMSAPDAAPAPEPVSR